MLSTATSATRPSVPGGGRRRRRRRRARAARGDGRRDGRGVREHLLDRGLAAEPRPRAPQRLLDRARRGRSRRSARSTIDLAPYQEFLLLLGAFFVPLFGVLLADWLVAGAHYRRSDFFAAPALRPGLIAAWLAGFALYQWLQPVGPSWWTDIVDERASVECADRRVAPQLRARVPTGGPRRARAAVWC